MVGEQKQKKRAQVGGVTTPKKRRPERPLIGSGSTWKEEQLEVFKVHVVNEAMDPRRLIPGKWFDYGNLERYQSGTDHSDIS
jgi:hypothetical protein